ncbi:hypothetical protein HK101_009041 [Irineochytrium annulatum]|nr:hypothetical protein HK101_009041 [Irineochytrium annulatum]
MSAVSAKMPKLVIEHQPDFPTSANSLFSTIPCQPPYQTAGDKSKATTKLEPILGATKPISDIPERPRSRQQPTSPTPRLKPLPTTSTTTTPPLPPYVVPGPHVPPGPPPGIAEMSVSNPALLPPPLAANRRFHARTIHPAYLLQLSSAPSTAKGATPDTVYMGDYGKAQTIPAKYLAAFNAAAAVNGRPLAVASTNPVLAGAPSPTAAQYARQHHPVTTASISAASGIGSHALPPAPTLPLLQVSPAGVISTPTDRMGVPLLGAPPLLGPLEGGCRVSIGCDWQGFGGAPRSQGAGGHLNSAFQGAIGGGEVQVMGERAMRAWTGLLQAPVPVGRRGWNHVGGGRPLHILL